MRLESKGTVIPYVRLICIQQTKLELSGRFLVINLLSCEPSLTSMFDDSKTTVIGMLRKLLHILKPQALRQ